MFAFDIFSIFMFIGCVIAFYLDLKKRQAVQRKHTVVCLMLIFGPLWLAFQIRHSFSGLDLFRAIYVFAMGLLVVTFSDLRNQLRKLALMLGTVRARRK
ncbi:MAG: hypothetical protein LCH63_13670 [Candidatus Melainabacteria bacterium]|nr:hypothetical protein [Candidatus Melainabacteria bacterium]